MKTREMRAANMSLVNLVMYFTKTEPWKKATTMAMIKFQMEIQKRQGRNSTSAILLKSSKAVSYKRIGPVTPGNLQRLINRHCITVTTT